MSKKKRRAGKRGSDAPKRRKAPVRPAVGYRWRDTRGRWRDAHGRYTAPPHTPKKTWPRRRQSAPQKPKPWRPPRVTAKTKAPHPARAKTLPVPKDLYKPGRVIGQTPRGADIVAPTLKKLAKKLGRSEKTIAGWLKKGRMPKWAAVNVERLLRGGRTVAERWEHGRRAKWTRDERRELLDALKEFVSKRQTSMSALEIRAAHDAWRTVKDAVRAVLSKKAWAKLMTSVGRKVGLPERGSFSIESFIIT